MNKRTTLALALLLPTAVAAKEPASTWPAACHLLRSLNSISSDQPIAVTLKRNGKTEFFRCNPVKRDMGLPAVDFTLNLY